MKLNTTIKTFSIALMLAVGSTSFAGTVINDILAKKEFVIGSRPSAAPFSATLATTETNEHVGYSTDICLVLQKRFDEKFKVQTTTKYLDVTSSNRFSMLDNNSIDIECAGTSVKPEQAKVAEFGVMYSDSIVAGGLKGTAIKSLDDLKDKRVAITANFSGEPLIREFFQKNGIAVTQTNLQSAPNYDAAFLLLKQHRVDVVVTNRSLLVGEINKQKDAESYTIIDGARFKDKDLLAILLPAKDKELSSYFKTEIKSMLEDGTLNKLHMKHFGSPMPESIKQDIANYYK